MITVKVFKNKCFKKVFEIERSAVLILVQINEIYVHTIELIQIISHIFIIVIMKIWFTRIIINIIYSFKSSLLIPLFE